MMMILCNSRYEDCDHTNLMSHGDVIPTGKGKQINT